ncbi:MAG: hypothetical protein VX185_12325 [Pseudomonadota bacterium]|nr:hypothetical protein [Pseudomonadota bacterium]
MDLEQEKRAIDEEVRKNTYEVSIFTTEEISTLVGQSPNPIAKKIWDNFNSEISTTVNFLPNAVDVYALSYLINELGGGKRALSTKIALKSYAGKQYIMLSGYTGLRKNLTASKYGINHAKIVNLSIGQAASKNSIRLGGHITIYLSVGLRAAEFLLGDEQSMTRLFAGLAVDVLKAIAAMKITGGLAALAYSAAPQILTYAIGPLAIVVAAGLIVGFGMYYFEKKYSISERAISALEGYLEDTKNSFKPSYHAITTLLPKELNKMKQDIIESIEYIGEKSNLF